MSNDYEAKNANDRLLDILTLERRDILIMLILIIGVGLLGISTPVAVQVLVNMVNMGGVMQPLYVVSIILFTLILLSGALYVLENYIVELIQRRIFVRSAIDATHKIQACQFEASNNSNLNELVNRFFDVMTMQKTAAGLLTTGLSSVLQGVIGCIILMFYSYYFIIAVFILVAFVIFIITVIGRKGCETAIKESTIKYEVAAWLETIAKNNHTFKFYNGKSQAENRTNFLIDSYLSKRTQHFKVLLMQNIGGAFMYAFFGTLMLMLGGTLVINGQINLGQFVAAELIIFSVLIAFIRVIAQLEYYYDISAAADKLGILQDLPQENIGSHPFSTISAYKLSIDMTLCTFSYLHPNLKRLKFEVQPNQKIAVLGSAGSGKSFLSELITGLITPCNGVIKYNDIDIGLLNMPEVRKSIGFAHNIEILEDTLLENIQFGRDVEIEEISSLLKELNFQDAVNVLEDGIYTKLNARGLPLNSAQQRKLILARAIIAKPHLLIINGILDNFDMNEIDLICKVLFKHAQSLLIMTTLPTIAARCDATIKLGVD